MTNLDRGVVRWDGINGGPGFSVFYATPGGSFMAAIRAFYSAIALQLPAGALLHFPSTGDTIDDATGALTGSWSGSVLSDVSGSGGAVYAAPAGCCVTWNTATIVPPGSSSLHSHRMRGRTYIVPLQSSALGPDGTVADTTVSSIQANVNTLVTAGAGHFRIWHRPATGSSDGTSGEVVSGIIHDRVAVLRSRRA